jgi:hypothetical protein
MNLHTVLYLLALHSYLANWTGLHSAGNRNILRAVCCTGIVHGTVLVRAGTVLSHGTGVAAVLVGGTVLSMDWRAVLPAVVLGADCTAVLGAVATCACTGTVQR